MPDAAGHFKGIRVPAAAWERIFNPKPRHPPADAVALPKKL